MTRTSVYPQCTPTVTGADPSEAVTVTVDKTYVIQRIWRRRWGWQK